MWVKRNEFDLSMERESNARGFAAFASFFLPVVVAVSDKLGISKFRSLDPLSWGEIFDRLHVYAIWGVGAYLVVYIYFRRKRLNSERFCIECEKIVRAANVETCSCGGKVDFLSDYKYVESDDEH